MYPQIEKKRATRSVPDLNHSKFLAVKDFIYRKPIHIHDSNNIRQLRSHRLLGTTTTSTTKHSKSHGRSHGRFDVISQGRFDVISHGRFDVISHGRFDVISSIKHQTREYKTHSSLRSIQNIYSAKMKCLHGELCAHTTTQNGSFWFCIQNPSCNLICSKDEGYLYEKAAAAWKSTKQPHPRCETHGKLAKMHVVKNLLKSNYSRPFFLCSDQTNPCSFWAWGNVQAVAKPKCRHGFPSVIRKVKKETVNKDRLFFCCAQEDSCNYFEWVPEKINQNDKCKEHTQQRTLSVLAISLT